jgi:hypothetical protein
MDSAHPLTRARRGVAVNVASSTLAAAVFLGVGAVGAARAATTPNFNNTNEANPSSLSAEHDVDSNTGSPGTTLANPLPTSGTIPCTPTLMSPFGSTGNTITVAGGSSKAKGGAGHSEGSNLAKITFPSGTGVDQTDPAPHDVGPSTFTMAFSYKWDLPGPGTLGPPMSGTFSVPIAAKVGTGPGAFARFEWGIQWDAVVNGALVTNVRSQFSGLQTFTGAGTHVTSVTAPASAFSPSMIPTGGNDDRLIVSGFIRFTANNDDSRTVIELLGPTLQDVDDEIRSDQNFLLMYNDPAHPEYRLLASSGFEEDTTIPEPSAALLAGAMLTPMLARRGRRQR